jgi:predicted nucleic acid-binding protein
VVLVDTSVWVEHLRRGVPELEALLSDGEVVCHPLVIGELACGNLQNRREILSLLRNLPTVPEVAHEELLLFVESHRLMGRGLGLTDVHLLASALIAGVPLWSFDRRLRETARGLHAAHP